MNLLKDALSYYNLGWNILPLFNNKKAPLVKWEKYQTVRITEEQIKEWFSQEATGIALITGKVSGVTVLDDDNYKKGNPFPLTSHTEVKTCSGGRHIYFTYGEVKSVNYHDDRYDFELQNDGKIIVLPPSSALNKKNEIAAYEWLSVGNLESLPPFPLDELKALVKKPTVKTSTPVNELLEVEHGNQHHSMIKLMNKLLFMSDESSWDTVIWNQVRAAAGNYVKDGQPYPYDERLLQKDWEDAKNFVRRKKEEKKRPKSIMEIAVERVEERKLERVAPSTGYEGLDLLIKGFVPGHLYTLSGHTNIGKTSISANFAFNVYKQGKRVLYFSFEPDNTIMDYFASIIGKKPYNEVSDEDIIESAKVFENMAIYTKEQVPTIKDIISVILSQERFDLIIIDHLGYFTRGEKMTVVQEQSNAVKELVQIAKEYKTAILQIVHLNKQAEDTASMKHISGSAAIYQDSTEVLLVQKRKDEGAVDKEFTTYLDEGFIGVHKTKAGKNGKVDIYFQPDSAYISETPNWAAKSLYG